MEKRSVQLIIDYEPQIISDTGEADGHDFGPVSDSSVLAALLTAL